jgi:hypothetical protein
MNISPNDLEERTHRAEVALNLDLIEEGRKRDLSTGPHLSDAQLVIGILHDSEFQFRLIPDDCKRKARQIRPEHVRVRQSTHARLQQLL